MIPSRFSKINPRTKPVCDACQAHRKELLQFSLLASGGVQRNCRVPDSAHELHALGIVPDMGGHRASFAGAGRHGRYSLACDGKKVEHETGDYGVETTGDSRQIRKLRHHNRGAFIGGPLAGECDVSRRAITTNDDPGCPAEIQPLTTRRDREPMKELWRRCGSCDRRRIRSRTHRSIRPASVLTILRRRNRRLTGIGSAVSAHGTASAESRAGPKRQSCSCRLHRHPGCAKTGPGPADEHPAQGNTREGDQEP